jgi:hypothetical protein
LIKTLGLFIEIEDKIGSRVFKNQLNNFSNSAFLTFTALPATV